MPIDLSALPDDPETLQQMLREAVTAAQQQQAVLQGTVSERDAEIDKLRLLIQRLLRHQFGRRSEQLSSEQLQLGLEDLEQSLATNQAGPSAIDAGAAQQRPRRETGSERNHGALPAHLPRYEVLIDVERRDCPCCGGALHPIGELRTEQLDIVPAQLRVRVTRRPRYACRICGGLWSLPRHRNVRSTAAWRPRRWWRMWWSASSAPRCRCIGSRRCWRVRGWNSTARPSATG